MKKIFLISANFICILFGFLKAQDINKSQQEDNTKEKIGVEAEEKTDKDALFIPDVLKDYLFRKENTSSEIFAKPLSIDTYYNHNFLRRDTFGYMFFPNIGQPLNPLVYKPSFSLIPQGGFYAKSFNYLTSEQVKYFDVKTPTTEIFYEGKYGQTQDPIVAEILFTHNPRKEFNYSLAYNFLKSPNYFPQEEATRQRIIATVSYQSPSDLYGLKAHYVNQKIENQENFGMKDFSNYQNQKESVRGLRSLGVLFSQKDSSKSLLAANRFYLHQKLKLFDIGKQEEDIEKYLPKSSLYHIFSYEPKKYSYHQIGEYKNGQTNPFGTLLELESVKKDEKAKFSQTDLGKSDEVLYSTFSNQIGIMIEEKNKFSFDLGFAHDLVTYNLNTKLKDPPLEIAELQIPNFRENVFSLKGNLSSELPNFAKLVAKGGYSFSKNALFGGNLFFELDTKAKLYKNLEIGGNFSLSRQSPSLNLVAYKSFYKDLNYYNKDFEKIYTDSLNLFLSLNPIVSLTCGFKNIKNHTYFGTDKRPTQYKENIQVFDVLAKNNVKFWKLGLENTAKYQNVFQRHNILELPKFILRSSLYYEDTFYDKINFQAGITLNYFTKFNSYSLFPPLSEFVYSPLLPNTKAQRIGGYPFLDAFINLSIFRVKIYLKILHLNSEFSGNNYFVSPGYPAKRWDPRIGISWNLFT